MQRFIENHTNEHFDVIVIGGGITGASVAYEAATRGLKVALLEKKDFSWATSAVTSKLIHGGMRYLANGEIRLVRESLRERRVLENIAPNFVYPMPVMMTHNNTQFKNNKWVVKVGMLMYDVLSYDKNFTWDKSKKIPMHKTISRQEVLKREPNVRATGLTGASIFYDCTSIFPERLTLAFIKSAVAYGAKVSNYTRVDGFLFNDRHEVTGVQVKDLLSGTTHTLSGTITINCGGPWADIVLGLAKSNSDSCVLRRSEGIHIITGKKLLSGKYVVGLHDPVGTSLLPHPLAEPHPDRHNRQTLHRQSGRIPRHAAKHRRTDRRGQCLLRRRETQLSPTSCIPSAACVRWWRTRPKRRMYARAAMKSMTTPKKGSTA